MKDEKINLYQTSYESPEIGLAEMVYDKTNQKTAFIAYKDNATKLLEKIELAEDKVVLPLKPTDDRIRLNVVKLPSEVSEYETEQGLYKEIFEFISKYVLLPDKFLALSSAYVMMSWVYDRFQVIPYLRVIGDYGTGKSRFLEVVGSLCYRPIAFTGSASNASIFRTIADINGTILLDEADFQESEKHADIVKLLNAGHKKGGAVQRAEANPKNNSFTIKTFSVYGPKVIGSREKWKDNALESRCLTQVMFSNSSSTIPILLPETFEHDAKILRNKLLNFRFKNYDLIKIDEKIVESLTVPRMRQTVLAVATIAKFIGDKKIIKAVMEFARDSEQDLIRTQTVSDEADIIICICRLMVPQPKKIHMQDIADHYNKDFGRGGSNNYTNFNPQRLDITANKVGHIIHKKLLLQTTRDNEGIYIPVNHQKERIESLISRYGITKEIIAAEEVAETVEESMDEETKILLEM